MRLQVPVANFVWYLALFLRTIDDGHVALAAPTEAGAGGCGSDRIGSSNSGPDKSGSQRQVHRSDPAWVRRPREDAKMGGANSTSVHPRTHARKQPQPRISATIHALQIM
jgi:hypothetical protein